jgi:hypothetical protein
LIWHSDSDVVYSGCCDDDRADTARAAVEGKGLVLPTGFEPVPRTGLVGDACADSAAASPIAAR